MPKHLAVIILIECSITLAEQNQYEEAEQALFEATETNKQGETVMKRKWSLKLLLRLFLMHLVDKRISAEFLACLSKISQSRQHC